MGSARRGSNPLAVGSPVGSMVSASTTDAARHDSPGRGKVAHTCRRARFPVPPGALSRGSGESCVQLDTAEARCLHDRVSERLRRWTRNPLGSARRGSNPLAVAFQSPPGGTARRGRGKRTAAKSCSTLLIDKNILRNKDTHGWGTLLWTSCISTPALAGGEALSFTDTGLGTAALPRQCVRAADEMDSKSIGLCPQGFESPRCRITMALRRRALFCARAWGPLSLTRKTTRHARHASAFVDGTAPRNFPERHLYIVKLNH